MPFTGQLGTADSQLGNLVLGQTKAEVVPATGSIISVLPALGTAVAGGVESEGPIAGTLPGLATQVEAVHPTVSSAGPPSTDRHVSFAFELLDSDNRHKRWLDDVVQGSGQVANNALAEIKRTARFEVVEGSDIDWLADRIKPWAILNGISYPLGIFLPSSPTRRHSRGVVVRHVEAYDQAVILREDKVDSRYTVAAGANYIAQARVVLESAGITEMNLTPSSKTLPAAREWDPGTPKLQIVNDLFGAINYRSLYFDSDGLAVGEPYLSPTTAPARHLYATDDASLVLAGAEEELDLFDISNKWVLYTSQPDQASLRSVYTNTNPGSPTSTVSRGRTIVDFRRVEAADQPALDAKVARLAFEASQVYTAVNFSTAIVPDHGESDVIDFVHSGLGISARYVEHTWELPLVAGGAMRHRIRRVVTV